MPASTSQQNSYLSVVLDMASYVVQLRMCSLEGRVADEKPYPVFSTLPEPLRKIIRETAEIQKYDTMFHRLDINSQNPNLDHFLRTIINQSYETHAQKFLSSDVTFIRWCVRWLIYGGQLIHKRFKEAPLIIIHIISDLVVTHEKYRAFRTFGCDSENLRIVKATLTFI